MPKFYPFTGSSRRDTGAQRRYQYPGRKPDQACHQYAAHNHIVETLQPWEVTNSDERRRAQAHWFNCVKEVAVGDFLGIMDFNRYHSLIDVFWQVVDPDSETHPGQVHPDEEPCSWVFNLVMGRCLPDGTFEIVDTLVEAIDTANVGDCDALLPDPIFLKKENLVFALEVVTIPPEADECEPCPEPCLFRVKGSFIFRYYCAECQDCCPQYPPCPTECEPGEGGRVAGEAEGGGEDGGLVIGQTEEKASKKKASKKKTADSE